MEAKETKLLPEKPSSIIECKIATADPEGLQQTIPTQLISWVTRAKVLVVMLKKGDRNQQEAFDRWRKSKGVRR